MVKIYWLEGTWESLEEIKENTEVYKYNELKLQNVVQWNSSGIIRYQLWTNQLKEHE